MKILLSVLVLLSTLFKTIYTVRFTLPTGSSFITGTGWDFTNTWWMSEGNTRPFLRMEYNTNIVNAHQLQLMAMNPTNSYTLGADIDMAAELSNASGMWNTTKGFVPVGNSSTQFTGQFDGLNHTISNLYINRPSQNYVGLFGYIGSGSSVNNVGLVGGSMQGNYYVGGLVGQNNGSISNAYTTGSVNGYYNVGGLVGYNNYSSTITNAYATGSVSGTTFYVGGLVGWNSGTTTNAYATGSVTGMYAVGGLVGWNSGTVNNAYATGSASGSNNVGGLVGSNSGGTVTNSFYNIDTVHVNDAHHVTLGGLYNDQYMDWIADKTLNIADYSSSLQPNGGYYEISTAEGLKDLLGFANASGYKFRLTADINLNDIKDGSGATSDWHIPLFLATEFDGNGHVLSNLNVNQPFNREIGFVGTMKSGTLKNIGLTDVSVTGLDYVGGLVGLNSGTVSNTYATGSVIGQNSVGGLVGLNYGSSTISNSYATGSVSGSYEVGGVVGRNDSTITNTHYNIDTVLINGEYHVTLGGLYNDQYMDWIADKNLNIADYSSTLQSNGGYYEISTAKGLKDLLGFADASGYKFRLTADINLNDIKNGSGATSDWHIPLFSATEFDGNGHILSNLNVNQPFNSEIGFIGTMKSGTLKNIGLTDVSVSGEFDVGGLVGTNHATISNSYTTGSVSGQSSVGGLVGYNFDNGSFSSQITNSYSMASVSGSYEVGGLVGLNCGTITNAYAMGSVSGIGDVGGLVGYNNGGTITNSYWDTITSGTSTGIGDGTTTGATGLTTAQMMDSANFSGWTFGTAPSTGDWFLISGNTRPFLQMEYSTNIINAHQMQLMAMDLTASYTLGANIDMAAELANPSGMWGTASSTVLTGITTRFSPVGNNSTRFNGTFDGLGHTISNLTINRPTQSYVGLFGYTGSGSTVSNVGLVGGSVIGNYCVGGLVGRNPSGSISYSYTTGSVSGISSGIIYLGGLVGYNENGIISNSYTTGSVTGSGSYVGGLAGHNDGTISNSYATGSVSNSSDTTGGLVGRNFGTVSNSYATGDVNGRAYAGGLAGYNDGTIENAYATGNVISSGNYIGGLVGFNATGRTITNSYATGNVSGGNSVGGLVGRNVNGTVSNSYAIGSVNGTDSVGGLVGSNYSSSSTITNSYATGSVTGTSNIGGLVGTNGGTVTNSFWDKQTTGQLHSSGSDDSYGKSTAEMMTKSTFDAVWDFTDTWWMVDGNTRPFLQMEYSTTIINAHQLQLMAMNLGAIYTLGADIVMSELTNPSGMWGTQNATYLTGITTGFVPIGNSSTKFTGTFDGQNHTITGLTINRSSQNYVGLFGYVGSDGTVSNVGLVGGSVSGHNNVGELAGLNLGTITNAYTTGNVNGTFEVGGLVGWNNNIVQKAYATGSVSGIDDVGGLAGGNGNSITNAYATGSVNGKYYIGGLVGFNIGTVSNSYATGSVTGTHDVGGLIGGGISSGTNSFWNTETTGQSSSTGGTAASDTYNMETKALTNGLFSSWNTSIWNIADGSYPTLE